MLAARPTTAPTCARSRPWSTGPRRWRGSGATASTTWKTCSRGWTNDCNSRRDPLRGDGARHAFPAGEALARPDHAAPAGGVADEDHLPPRTRPRVPILQRLAVSFFFFFLLLFCCVLFS